MTALSLPAGLLPVWAIPTSRTQTSNRSVSNHPADFLRRFPPCSSARDSATPLLFTRGYLGLWGRSGLRLIPSRLANHVWPNRVRRYPTDRLFTSRCSPPRLAATQLRSVTCGYMPARLGLSPCCLCALVGALGRRRPRRAADDGIASRPAASASSTHTDPLACGAAGTPPPYPRCAPTSITDDFCQTHIHDNTPP